MVVFQIIPVLPKLLLIELSQNQYVHFVLNLVTPLLFANDTCVPSAIKDAQDIYQMHVLLTFYLMWNIMTTTMKPSPT